MTQCMVNNHIAVGTFKSTYTIKVNFVEAFGLLKKWVKTQDVKLIIH